MKIGMVRGDLAAAGGAERYALGMIGELLKRGHEVHVFTSRFPQEQDKNVVVHQFTMPRRVMRASRGQRQKAFSRWLQAEQSTLSLDLLFTLERVWPSDIFRAGDGVHREWLNICMSEAGMQRRLSLWLQPFHRQVLATERAVFNELHTRMVVCNSQMVAREIEKHYAYPPQRLRVVPNGTDTKYFEPASAAQRETMRRQKGITPDDLAVLFVGSGFWRKGVDVALEIVAQWRQISTRPLKFFVVGKDKLETYQQQARRLGVADIVQFVGPVAPGEVLNWYQIADVFLFPTRYDPFANVCLEANACGVPVITTPTNGFAEQIQSGANGLVLSNADASEQARQIKRFCGSLPSAETVRQVVAHLTLEAHSTALLQVIDECRALK
jgi:UDP-glucose:(heptosyl)LPS alpha-1,3-glucosyltransferase